MKLKLLFLILALSFAAAFFAFWNNKTTLPETNIGKNIIKKEIATNSPAVENKEENKTQNNKIVVDSPKPNDIIKSPLTISGQARGNWYFEASFPVSLVDNDGVIIANGTAQAQGEWMTENFVPFSSDLEFAPITATSGSLILKKDNPSGMPENDDEIKIPIKFR